MTDVQEESTFVPVTPRDRGQEDRTADREQPQGRPNARARDAGAREKPIIPSLSAVTDRVGQKMPGRGNGDNPRGLWKDGAEAAADVIERGREQVAKLSTTTGKARKVSVLLWALYLFTVGAAVTWLLAAVQYSATHKPTMVAIVVLAVAVAIAAATGEAPAAGQVAP